MRSNSAASSVDASARVVSKEPSVSENIALFFKDATASSTADRWRRVSSVSFAEVSAFATDATSGSALSSSSRLRETPGSSPKADSEPLAAKEAPPNRPAAWIFLAAAWNRLIAAPGPTAFFFEGDEYRPSMDFLRLPLESGPSSSPSTDSVASDLGGEGGGTPSAMAARAQRRRDAAGSESGFVPASDAVRGSSSSSSERSEEDREAFRSAIVAGSSSSSPKSSTNETFFEEDSFRRADAGVASVGSSKTDADSDCESSATSSSGPRLLAPSLSPSLPENSSRLRCRSLFRRIKSLSEGDASGGGVMSIAVTTKAAETRTPLVVSSPSPKKSSVVA